MKVDALVLAGSDNQGKLREVSDAAYEALIPLNGRPMVTYVLDALRNTASVSNIVVVGPPNLRPYLQQQEVLVESADTLSENIQRGVESLKEQHMVLLVTSDIPFVNPAAIEDFLNRCQGRQGDVFYPVVSREVNEQRFHGVERTYFQLKEGVFTGGNISLVSPQAVKRSGEIIHRVVSMRKKPWQLSRMLGFLFIIKFLMHRLSFSEIEERAEAVLGVEGVAIVSPYPEIGVDVDKPSDYHLAQRMLGENGPSFAGKEENHA